MDTRNLLASLLVGLLALGGPVSAQELYYGAEDDTSPEEYYLEGIGYGDEDYGSYSAEDTSYSGLYSPSADEPVYEGVSDYEPVIYDVEGDEGYGLPAEPAPGGAAAGPGDAADWFSMAGVALLEVVGDDQTGRVLIARDAQGGFRVLSEGDTQAGAFKVLGIGSEQARVEPVSGGPAKVVPILHRPAPLDALITAVARLQNLRVAIGTSLTREVNLDASMMDLEEGFAPLLATESAFMKRFDDVVVVRGAPFLTGGGGYEPAEGAAEGETLDLSALRMPGAAALDKIGSALPEGLEGGPDAVPDQVTLVMGVTPAAEALHYLNLAWATDYRVKEPAEPAAPEQVASSKAERLYREAAAFARKGDFREAGRRLLYLCRNGSQEPKHYQALGKVYWKLNRAGPAIRAWRAGLKVDPDNAATRRLLVRATQRVRQLRSRQADQS